MLTLVQFRDLLSGDRSAALCDLDRGTLSQHFGLDLSFCYYHEFDTETVMAGLTDAGKTLQVFTLLVDGEPRDLQPERMDALLLEWPEFIPGEEVGV